MLTFLLTLAGLFALWFFTGLGLSCLLTRRTIFFRNFPGLSILFAQLLVVLTQSFLGTHQPDRITATALIAAHSLGLALSAAVIWRLGWRRIWRFARFRMTPALAIILLASLLLQVAPCFGRNQFCYISHMNDEYLNYSGAAQWANGQAAGNSFMTQWRVAAHGRFGAEILLADLSRWLAIPPAYAILPLQALSRIQYLFAAVLFFCLGYRGAGPQRRWGAVAIALLLLLSPLESQNYLLAFLANHLVAAAIAILCATLLLRPVLPLAMLQGALLLYLSVTYIETILLLVLVMGVNASWRAWHGKTWRPAGYLAGITGAVFAVVYLRDPQLIPSVVFRLGSGGAGFMLLGDPSVDGWSHLAALLSLSAEITGAVFAPEGWLQYTAAAVGLAYLVWGICQATFLRRNFWTGLIALIVIAAHFDLASIISGKLRIVQPVYAGPKAFIYFHFLWITSIVTAALSGAALGRLRWLVTAGACIWAIPVLLTGGQYLFRAQPWAAVSSVEDDLALVAKIPPGSPLVIASVRPDHAGLWLQLLAYTGHTSVLQSANQSQGPIPATYVVPRHAYYIAPPRKLSTRPLEVPCSQVLGMSVSFVLCGDKPSYFATAIQLKGTLKAWGHAIQPLIFCGQPGEAVLWGLKNEADGNASLVIDEWGIPLVSSPIFPLLPGQEFRFLAEIDHKRNEVSITTSTGETVRLRVRRNTILGNCAPIIGANPTDAGLMDQKFSGSLTGQLQY